MTPQAIADRSTCTRTLPTGKPAHVGCILRVTSNHRGEVARAESANGGACTGKPGACGCTHAEMGALAKLSSYKREAHEALWLMAEITLSPCDACACALLDRARDLQAALIVYYGQEYRVPSGLDILRQSGAVTWQISTL